MFDLGGVLELTPRTGVAGRWEHRLGLGDGELDRCLDGVWRTGSIGSISEREVHARIEAILGVTPKEAHTLMDELWEEYVGTPNEELMEYFRRLRPRYRTAVLSNSFVGAREREQARYGLVEMTDVVIYSHEIGMIKPDARVYAVTCDELGLPPAETVFLDDVEENVAGAREAGMRAVRFESNTQAIEEVEACLRAR